MSHDGNEIFRDELGLKTNETLEVYVFRRRDQEPFIMVWVGDCEDSFVAGIDEARKLIDMLQRAIDAAEEAQDGRQRPDSSGA